MCVGHFLAGGCGASIHCDSWRERPSQVLSPKSVGMSNALGLSDPARLGACGPVLSSKQLHSVSSHSHTKPTQGSNRKPRNLPRIVRPRCPRGQTPTSTTPGETRQGGVKRSGTIAPRSHQLPLNGNFRNEEREKPTHLKEKPNKNCLVCTTQPKDDSSLAGLFRETRGGGDHTRAHQPLRPWPAASAHGFLAYKKSKP